MALRSIGINNQGVSDCKWAEQAHEGREKELAREKLLPDSTKSSGSLAGEHRAYGFRTSYDAVLDFPVLLNANILLLLSHLTVRAGPLSLLLRAPILHHLRSRHNYSRCPCRSQPCLLPLELMLLLPLF